jgi:REP-associated tyrosine transposase
VLARLRWIEMPRPLRLRPAGGIFHLTARGNRRENIFLDEIDRERFLDLLTTVIARRAWICHAYCLMDNHVHLLIETSNEDLSEGMQQLLGQYAQGFNRRHGFDGHLFQGRFDSRLIVSNWHLLELARYIVLNPVRAGMRASAAEWAWSSYRAAAGTIQAPSFLTLDWLLGQFGRDCTAAREAYRRFVMEAPIRASP